MSSGQKYFADISFDRAANIAQIVAEFGPCWNAEGYLKLILSLASSAKEECILTSDQLAALSSILPVCRMALTTSYLKSSRPR